MTNLTPSQLRRRQREWKAKKDDDRARAAYRNSLPQGIARLNGLLAEAPSSWHADVIVARIETVREQGRHHNRVRRTKARMALMKETA